MTSGCNKNFMDVFYKYHMNIISINFPLFMNNLILLRDINLSKKIFGWF